MNTPLALQLYTVRDDCARDFRGTLQAVADMGFDAVELAGLHGHEPEQVRDWLDRAGLVACSAHAGVEDLDRNLERQIALAHLFGYTRIVMPWTALRTRAEITDMLRTLARAAALLHEDGLALGYHNHEFEMDRWPDGGRILDLVLAETSLFLEPDLGWLWYAGEDPRAFLEHHGPRCPLVHVKEFARRGQRSYCPLGAGGVGYADLLPFLDEMAPEAIILEQDESPDQPPLAACAQSIDFVRTALRCESPTETA
jgi:sugar phosphate isomerase/epimerase